MSMQTDFEPLTERVSLFAPEYDIQIEAMDSTVDLEHGTRKLNERIASSDRPDDVEALWRYMHGYRDEISPSAFVDAVQTFDGRIMLACQQDDGTCMVLTMLDSPSSVDVERVIENSRCVEPLDWTQYASVVMQLGGGEL